MSISIAATDLHVDMQLLSIHDYNLKKRLVATVTRKSTHITSIKALAGIDLLVPEGARLGLVGANGSGKTTLLRVMAGTLIPSSGSLVTQGRVAAMLDGNLGIDAEATGYENIVIRGLLLGQSRAGIQKALPDIAEFSGLGDRLRHAVHTYSSGMRARLAFSIATSIDPEILLLDEGIGTADVEFTARANERLRTFLGRAGILVIASHSQELLRQFCDWALWLEAGRIVDHGPVDEVLTRMSASSRPSGGVPATSLAPATARR